MIIVLAIAAVAVLVALFLPQSSKKESVSIQKTLKVQKDISKKYVPTKEDYERFYSKEQLEDIDQLPPPPPSR